jgi:hypothetical protein
MLHAQAQLSLLLPHVRTQVQPHAALLTDKDWAYVSPFAQHNATQACCVCFAKSAAQRILAQLQSVLQGVSDVTMQAHWITAEPMHCAADSTLISTIHCTLR